MLVAKHKVELEDGQGDVRGNVSCAAMHGIRPEQRDKDSHDQPGHNGLVTGRVQDHSAAQLTEP